MSDKTFFIGWEENPAPAAVKKCRTWALAAGVAGLVLLGGGAALQQGFKTTGSWDFTEKTFAGILVAEPYPTLITDEGIFYLVRQNKEAIRTPEVEPLHLSPITVRGSVISDATQPVAMIALTGVEAITREEARGEDPMRLARASDPVTLRGEIVDSKCAFGAMNPGVLKPHRACAIACLAGDIPPVLVVRHEGGTSATHYLLVDETGHPMKETALEYAALPIEITGIVTTVGDWHILHAAPTAISLLR